MRRTRARREVSFTLTLAATVLGLFVVMLDTTVVNVVLPALQHSTHASITTVEWIGDAYTLAFAVALLPAGAACDRLGPGPIFLAGAALFAATSVVIAALREPGAIAALRGVQGLGGGLLMPSTLAVLIRSVPESRRTRAIGIWTGASSLAIAIGPVIGGGAVSLGSWRWAFLINPTILVLAASLLWLAGAARRGAGDDHDAALDWGGMTLVAGSIALLVLYLISAGEDGFWSARQLTVLAAGATLAVAFGFVERRVPHPLLRRTLLTQRGFVGASAVAFAVYFSGLGSLLFLGIFLQRVLAFSALGAGAALLPSTLAIMVAGLATGRLIAAIGTTRTITAGLLALGVGALLLAGLRVGSSATVVVLALLPFGLGMGLCMAPLTVAAMTGVSPADSGVASGLLGASRMLGATFGIALLGDLVASGARTFLRAGPRLDILTVLTAHSGATRLAQAYTSGMAEALMAAAGMTALGVAFTVLILARPRALERGAAIGRRIAPRAGVSWSFARRRRHS